MALQNTKAFLNTHSICSSHNALLMHIDYKSSTAEKQCHSWQQGKYLVQCLQADSPTEVDYRHSPTIFLKCSESNQIKSNQKNPKPNQKTNKNHKKPKTHQKINHHKKQTGHETKITKPQHCLNCLQPIHSNWYQTNTVIVL